MEREGRKHDEVGREKDDITLLQNLDRDGIIKKCLEYKSSLAKAKEDIDIYRSLLTKLVEQHELLKAKVPDLSQTGYDKSWSWTNKIVFVLKKIDRPLLSSEIIEFITPYEPVLQYSRHKAQAFSANLTKAVKYGRVRPYKLQGARGFYYVLPTWLDVEGRLQGAYEQKIFFK